MNVKIGNEWHGSAEISCHMGIITLYVCGLTLTNYNIWKLSQPCESVPMGLMSTSISMTRYLVEGRLEDPVLENAADALKRNAIRDIDDESVEKSVGWTSFETPFTPNFDGSSFSLGSYLVFSMRIDKKSVPNQMVKKMVTRAEAQRMADAGRDMLSNQEKKTLKEQVIHSLFAKIPATPNVYDLVWNYEAGELWFFTNLKAANEALESLFRQTFRLTLIRLFPYTAANLKANLKDSEKDILKQLKQTQFYANQR